MWEVVILNTVIQGLFVEMGHLGKDLSGSRQGTLGETAKRVLLGSFLGPFLCILGRLTEKWQSEDFPSPLFHQFPSPQLRKFTERFPTILGH